jgi:hypothetical protein
MAGIKPAIFIFRQYVFFGDMLAPRASKTRVNALLSPASTSSAAVD